MITCPNCGRENADTVRLCSYCDHELQPTGAIDCPACGRVNAPENEVCPHCGTRLKAAAPTAGAPSETAWGAPAEAPAELPDWLTESAPQAEPPAEGVFDAAIEETVDSASLATRTEVPSAKEPPAADDLREALADLEPAETEPVGLGAAEGAPDDMRDLFFDLAAGPEAPSPIEAEPAAEAAPEEEELPDWFTADSLRVPEEEAEPLAIEVAPAEEEPDWLTDSLGVPEEEAEPLAVEVAPVEEEPDWLTDSLGVPEEEVEPLAIEVAPAEEEPDWLTDSLRVPEEAAPDVDLPDWLKVSPAEPTAPAEAPSELPDWLAESALEPKATPAVPAEPEPPDWLKEDRVAPVEPARPKVVSDDWLDQALGAEPAEAKPVEAPPADLDTERPDWLTEAIAPAAPEPAQPEARVVSDTWLDRALGAEPAEAKPAAPDEAMPDWLAATKTPLAADEAETPDWLMGTPAAPSPPAEADLSADTPNWLAELFRDAQAPPSEEIAAPDEPRPLVAEVEPPATEDMPDWLKTVTKKPTDALPPLPPETEIEAEEEHEPGSPISSAFGLGPLGEDDMPDWLRAMQPEGVEGVEAAPPPPTPAPFEGSLTDLLEAELASFDKAIPVEAGEEKEGEEEEVTATEPLALESADMPAWLRALRPAEAGPIETEARPTAAPVRLEDIPEQMEMLRAAHIPGALDSETDAREEHVGPLRGVVGVVTAAPVFAELQRPAVTRTEAALEVDSTQISLLQDLLGVRAEGIPAVERVGRLAEWLGRWLVSLLLIAAVALPVVGGMTPFDSPETIEIAAADAARSLNTLDPSSNVLLAFEYDPSQAGEISAEAEALIAVLMARGATLYAVSTQPTGPAIAQDLLETLADEHGYVYGEDYFNLGYVSGKAAGVRGLVIGGAAGTVSPTAFDYRGTPTGFGNARLSDLDIEMIVLLAGTPESVRTWVEQAANPSGIRIVAAVGAGTEPMALPYYRQGRQLEGIVSGLAGATSLTLATQDLSLPASLNTRMNAQVAGALAAGLAVLVGVGVQVTASVSRRRQERP